MRIQHCTERGVGHRLLPQQKLLSGGRHSKLLQVIHEDLHAHVIRQHGSATILENHFKVYKHLN
jgi:hypothetical protein